MSCEKFLRYVSCTIEGVSLNGEDSLSNICVVQFIVHRFVGYFYLMDHIKKLV